MKKVLLTEPIHEEGVKLLEEVAEVVQASDYKIDTLVEEAADCHGIIIRKAEIPTEVIKNAPQLEVVAKHGVGVDNIDIETATKEGVVVVNAPESNIYSVAEHTLTMILTIAKNFVVMDKEVREGRFHSRDKIIGTELKGKTAGIIGMGTIGLILTDMLQAMDVEVIAYDPYADPVQAEEAGIELVDELDDIYARADIVSLHLPLNDETEGMIDEDAFAKMKESAFFINAARGAIADEEALYEALKTGEIKGAALDVYTNNPPSSDNPLFELDNVVCSPHNAALTEESKIKMATHAAQGVIDCFKGEEPEYLINPEVLK
ncbi:hydroxyacid dehydrogenase [Acetohalobium arabaticum]|uniref:D-isomer specific 2-hydroxyacid dehydrogenase NAD-binding protein n=1 Tax=Acetohalobium arabaticum (strain ATCC 49924 / DSM 5501 / Z-7288) TaxID=574087 RepID=D9QPN4_ACEAZ|nr:hydroxyacid dehydrogenase [Acetohalobium arabaticum]ADL12475.1 D-isomer specific 2-hydroxyacid dehydrogenase NAD-binding protein [Acetohalobium arabaticum DSM 5501]